jgi:hypothetical protein
MIPFLKTFSMIVLDIIALCSFSFFLFSISEYFKNKDNEQQP